MPEEALSSLSYVHLTFLLIVQALLLLIQLTKGNANIQKIVAFENAFERLIEIIRDEGNSDGGRHRSGLMYISSVWIQGVKSVPNTCFTQRGCNGHNDC